MKEITEEQKSAISARGRVAVAASAGSGKTFVMIERLVALVLGGVDIRRILAVTFTNKAAAQIKERLRESLIQKIADRNTSPELRSRLKEQLKLLPLADMSTIHSFCGRLIRTYFYLADTTASFRVISPDDAEGKELSARALDLVFEEAYDQNEADFQDLLAVYFRRHKDSRLRELVTELYGKFRALEGYREKLEQAGQADEFSKICDELYSFYVSYLNAYAADAEECKEALSDNPRAMQIIGEAVEQTKEIAKAGSLFEAATLAGSVAFSRMPPKTKAEGEKLKALEGLSRAVSGIKELCARLRGIESEDEEKRRYDDGRSLARGIAKLCLSFDGHLTELKNSKGVLDYNDLEQRALRILQNEDVRKAVREKYEYVFVDEYQDVNPVQEKILRLSSGEEIFVVGDAKQSIYGFRGSKAKYFADTCKEFENSLLLTKNFRSSMGVIDAVNAVFGLAMTEESCGIDYLKTSYMRGGEGYRGNVGGTYVHRYQKTKEEKTPPREVYSVLAGEKDSPSDGQAEAAATIVQQEVGRERFDSRTGTMKRIGYGDIAILVRKSSGDAERIVSELSRRNIPVATTAKVNICTYYEIRVLIDILSFLDNPEQDVPRASAMLSPIGGFTDEELAKIRIRFPSAYYFRTACKEYSSKMADPLSGKLKEFEETAATLRAACAAESAAEIIYRILSLGLEADIAARQDGARKLARVRRLISEASGSVHEFLARLSRIGEKIDFSESGGEDAVQVVTMHASKGLEYPVVILASLDAPFHGPDQEEVMFSENYFLAPRSYDREKKVYRETLLRSLLRARSEEEERRGELNLLYVAMTRAEYRLHLLLKEGEAGGDPRRPKRFSDFFSPESLPANVSYEEEEIPLSARSVIGGEVDEELKAKLIQRLHAGSAYLYEASTSVPVKSSATDLLGRVLHGVEEDIFAKDAGESSAEEGTAYHAFLEHVRFGSTAKEEISRMQREKILPEETISLLDEEKCERILNIPCLKALKGMKAYREQRFLVRLKWRELFPDSAAEDEVVFQGAIDLFCETEEGYRLIDYKYSAREDDALKKRYALQIALYKKVIAKIMRVDESTIKADIVNILRCREIPC